MPDDMRWGNQPPPPPPPGPAVPPYSAPAAPEPGSGGSRVWTPPFPMVPPPPGYVPPPTPFQRAMIQKRRVRPVELQIVVGILLFGVASSIAVFIDLYLSRHRFANYVLDNAQFNLQPSDREAFIRDLDRAFAIASVVQFVILGLTLLVIFGLWNGRDWAFILTNIFTFLNLLATIAPFFLHVPGWARSVNILACAIEGGIIVLLWRPPVREFFRGHTFY